MIHTCFNLAAHMDDCKVICERHATVGFASDIAARITA